MPFRKTALLTALLGVLVLLALVAGINRSTMTDAFAELERDEANRNLTRVVRALRDEEQKLDSVVFDWAVWDDARDFVLSRAKNFEKTSLNDRTLIALRLSAVIFLNRQGQAVWMGGYDPFRGVRTSVPPELLFRLLPGSPLTSARRPEDRVHGLMLLPQGPAVVASCPITGSDGADASVGTLIMVRALSDADVAGLGERTNLPLTIERADRPLAADIAPLAFGAPPDKAFGPISDSLFCAMAVLPDLWGQPAVRLELRLPRDLLQRGAGAMQLPHMLSTAAALVVLALLLLLLHDRLLRRVARANARLAAPLSGQLAATRDEPAALDQAADAVLRELERLRAALDKRTAEAEDNQLRLRALLNAVPVGLLLVDPESGRIREANARAASMAGERAIDMVGRTLAEVLHLPDGPSIDDPATPFAATLLRPNGDELPMHAVRRLLAQPGGALHLYTLTPPGPTNASAPAHPPEGQHPVPAQSPDPADPADPA